MPDPRKQECLGRFGYGDGWNHAYHVLQTRMMRRLGGSGSIPMMCSHTRCPVVLECCRQAVKKLRELETDDGGPIASRVYERNWKEGQRDFVAKASRDLDVRKVLEITRRIG